MRRIRSERFLQIGILVMMGLSFSSCTKAKLLAKKAAANIKATEESTAPVVHAILPNEGPIYGGTVVQIRGENFSSEMTVDIGGVSCGSLTMVNSTTARCTTGVRSAGAIAPVSVTTSNGASNTDITYLYINVVTNGAVQKAAGGVMGSTGSSGYSSVTPSSGAVSGIVRRTSIGVTAGTGAVGASGSPILRPGLQGVLNYRASVN